MVNPNLDRNRENEMEKAFGKEKLQSFEILNLTDWVEVEFMIQWGIGLKADSLTCKNIHKIMRLNEQIIM